MPQKTNKQTNVAFKVVLCLWFIGLVARKVRKEYHESLVVYGLFFLCWLPGCSHATQRTPGYYKHTGPIEGQL